MPKLTEMPENCLARDFEEWRKCATAFLVGACGVDGQKVKDMEPYFKCLVASYAELKEHGQKVLEFKPESDSTFILARKELLEAYELLKQEENGDKEDDKDGQ